MSSCLNKPQRYKINYAKLNFVKKFVGNTSPVSRDTLLPGTLNLAFSTGNETFGFIDQNNTPACCHTKQEASHKLLPATLGKEILFYYSLNLVTYYKVYLQLIWVTFLRFQSSKTIQVKAHSENHNEHRQVKGAMTWTCLKVFQEFQKIRKVTRRASMRKKIFNKIAAMQYLC